MIYHITPTTTLRQLQEDFHHLYPNLWLAFELNGKLAKQEKLGADSPFGDWNNQSLDLDLSPRVKVRELEQILKNHYQLDTQVKRKFKSLYITTSETDDWSLEEEEILAHQQATNYYDHLPEKPDLG